MKSAIFGVVALAIASMLSAQTPTHKPVQAVRPNTTAPTKVTGDGCTTTCTTLAGLLLLHPAIHTHMTANPSPAILVFPNLIPTVSPKTFR